MIYSRQRSSFGLRRVAKLDSILNFKSRAPFKYVLSLAAVLIAIGAVVYGRTGRVTRLWFPDSAPPSPPGMEARVHDGMPLPGGRIYVSPEEFEAGRVRDLGRGRK